MQATRRFWEAVGVAGTLVVGAVVLGRPILLAVPVLVGTWLIAHQYAYFQALRALDDGLTVDQTVDAVQVRSDEPAWCTLSVSLEHPLSVPLTIRARPPVGTTGSDASARTVRLEPGTTDARTSFSVTAPVAGTFTFEPARVTVADPYGLFREPIERGPTPTLRVEPRGPRNVHVGEGGEEIATAFGEHEAGQFGSGLTPAEIREYVPGDAARQIDWKATARLNEAHVREFEAETDRVTVLLFDHRASMGQGDPGETKLDYARQVALAFVDSARQLNDPLGWHAIGDGGVTATAPPASHPDRYEAIRRGLIELGPTQEHAPDEHSGPPSAATGVRALERQSPARARHMAAALEDESSPFARTLAPFFRATRQYVRRIEDDPLFRTARSTTSGERGATWTVLFTDDTNPTEVRETVKAARQGDDYVLVFLTPTVLFEPGGLADVEDAYDRYVDFETFRRDLAGLDRVSAFEVAPGDRIAAVLGHGRQRRRS